MKTNKIYYFDYASATPISKSILKSFALNQQEVWANSNSHHILGRIAADSIIEQRKKLANIMSVKADYIHFFPSATVCNNTAIFDIISIVSNSNKKNIYYSPLEHPSILTPLFFWANYMQVNLIEIPIYQDQLNFSVISNNISSIGAIIVSANTSSGIMNNIAILKDLLKNSNILWHCDISSLLYTRLDNLGNLGPSHITLTARKIYGLDIAVLLTKHLEHPLIKSSNKFAGTPSYALIHSFTQSIQEMFPRYEVIESLRSLRDMFESTISSNTNISIIGKGLHRLPNYSFLRLSKPNSDYIIYKLSKKNIMIGANIACQADLIYVDKNKYNNTLRVTFGYENTESDMLYLSQNIIPLLKD